MTACKDSLNGKKAVSATLAGVLAVGMVPAAAFADAAQADTNDEQGVELLTGEANQDFTKGQLEGISGYTYNADNEAWETTATGTAQKPVPTKVKTDSGKEVDIDSNFTIKYYEADAEGNATDVEVSDPTDPGSYVIVVTGVKGDYKDASISQKFTIKAAEFNTITYGNLNEDGTAITGTLVYTGEAQSIGFAQGGTFMEEGKDYTVTYYNGGGSVNDSTKLSGAPVDAGPYVARQTGLGKNLGKTKDVAVKVAAINLAQVTFAAITTADANQPTAVTAGTYSNKDLSEAVLSQLKLTLKTTGNDGKDFYGDNGVYKFTVAPSDSANKNFVKEDGKHKTGEVTVTKYGKMATFKYGKAALEDEYSFDTSKVENKDLFDVDNITAWNGKTELSAMNSGYTVAKTYAKYNTATEEWDTFTPETDGILDAAGTYKVTVTVSKVNDYACGGSAETVVTVSDGAVDADANVYISYDGSAAITEKTVNYGTAIDASKFTAAGKAKDIDGNDVALSSGSNGALKVTVKDADGKVKTGAITDAGEYTVEVTSDAYNLSGTTSITLTINKIDLTTLKFGDKFVVKSGSQYLPLSAGACSADQLKLLYNTGFDAAADPETAFKDGKGWDYVTYLGSTKNTDLKLTLEKYDTEKAEWVAVDKTGGEGDYRVTVAAKTDKLAKNYEFATEDGTTVEFKVADTDKFKFDDVTPDSWAFDAVAAVSMGNDFKGYMNGYNGTKIFGASDSITRGQVACVLFNIAGGTASDASNYYDETTGYKSFDDVNGKMYYGQAIAWAKSAGVVNGYTDGTFRPDQPVTREEFACMLANYAQKVGAFETPSADALSGMPDAAAVSEYAKESVAWAVENKLMGNGGVINPGAKISRAETACMVYNYAKANKLTLDE